MKNGKTAEDLLNEIEIKIEHEEKCDYIAKIIKNTNIPVDTRLKIFQFAIENDLAFSLVGSSPTDFALDNIGEYLKNNPSQLSELIRDLMNKSTPKEEDSLEIKRERTMLFKLAEGLLCEYSSQDLERMLGNLKSEKQVDFFMKMSVALISVNREVDDRDNSVKESYVTKPESLHLIKNLVTCLGTHERELELYKAMKLSLENLSCDKIKAQSTEILRALSMIVIGSSHPNKQITELPGNEVVPSLELLKSETTQGVFAYILKWLKNLFQNHTRPDQKCSGQLTSSESITNKNPHTISHS